MVNERRRPGARLPAPGHFFMQFLNNLKDILLNLLGILFGWVTSNPFVYTFAIILLGTLVVKSLFLLFPKS